MTSKPRLTVGLPVYNGELFIRETIESILSQTFTDFKLLISDNASTDSSYAICEQYARSDARIELVGLDENKGAAWNFNRIFEVSSSVYFKWAASDDICLPEFFERCIDILDRHPSVVMCYPQSVLINEEGEVIYACNDGLHLMEDQVFHRYDHYHRTFQDENHKSNPVFGISRAEVLAKTQLIQKFSGSDVTLLGELAMLGKIHEIPEKLFLRRDHPRASVREYKLQQRGTWFDPNITARFQFARWRLWRGHIRSVRHTPIPRVDKLRCYYLVGRWGIWNFKNLRREAAIFVIKLPFYLPEPVVNILRRIWHFGKGVLPDSDQSVKKI